MIDKVLADYLKIFHGSYNAIMALFFIHLGSLGWRIRKERKVGGKRDFQVIKKHRTRGPVYALLGILGYVAGVVLVYLDKGNLLEYPRHLTVGAFLVLLILTNYTIAKRIKGATSSWRTPHFMIGLFIILFYLIQIFVGLDIFF